MQHVYVRCPSTHYFRGARCPWDGWTSSAIVALVEACRHLRDAGGELSIAGLAGAGIGAEVLDRCLIVEFGDEGYAFDALWVLAALTADAVAAARRGG